MSKNFKAPIIALGLFLFSASGFADNLQERVDAKEQRQEQRIDEGVASGQITPGEEKRLDAQQSRINRLDEAGRDRAAARTQRRANRNIFRKKHNLRNSR